MDQDRFWSIIDTACRSDLHDADNWDRRLQEELAKYNENEIITWDHFFDRLAASAYKVDLWAAAYIINGGASDDGFYYFRCWLIGMGRKVYEDAMANPDSLADVVDPRVDAEAEIYAAAHQAWMDVTGRPDTDPYPARSEKAELQGQDWDFHDDIEVRRRLPQLAAIYLV